MVESDFMDEDGEDRKMPGSAWTTHGEYAFLQKYLPEYQDLYAQDSTKREKYSLFWNKLYQDWFAQYPEIERLLPGVSRQDLTDEQKKEVKDAIQKRKKSLTSWFRWRPQESSVNKAATRGLTRAANRGSDKKQKAKLAGIPTARKKNVGEVYSKLFYADKIEPLVKAHIEALPPGSKFNNGDRVVFVNKTAKDLYEKADEETKAIVQQEIARLNQENINELTDLTNGNRTPEQYHEAIIGLPNSLLLELHSLSLRTGYLFSLFGGGPRPEKNGSISVFSFHIGGVDGVNRFGETKGFDENIMKPFNQYVESAYPPEVRRARALTETTPPVEVGSSKHCLNSAVAEDVELQMNQQAVEVTKVDNCRETVVREADNQLGVVDNGFGISASNTINTGLGDVNFMDLLQDGHLTEAPPAELVNSNGSTTKDGLLATGYEARAAGAGGCVGSSQMFAGQNGVLSASSQHTHSALPPVGGPGTHQDTLRDGQDNLVPFNAQSDSTIFSMFDNFDGFGSTPSGLTTPSFHPTSMPPTHFLPVTNTYSAMPSGLTAGPSASQFFAPDFTPQAFTSAFMDTTGHTTVNNMDGPQNFQFPSEIFAQASYDKDQSPFFSQLNAISGYQLPLRHHSTPQRKSSIAIPGSGVDDVSTTDRSLSVTSSNRSGAQHSFSESHQDADYVPVDNLAQGAENRDSEFSVLRSGSDDAEEHQSVLPTLESAISHDTNHVTGELVSDGNTIAHPQEKACGPATAASQGHVAEDLVVAIVEQSKTLNSEHPAKVPPATGSTRSGRSVVPSKRNDQMSKIGTKYVSVIEKPMSNTGEDEDVSAWAILTKNYLLLTDLGDDWRNCVNAWFELEIMLGFGAVSGTKNPLPGSSKTGARPLEWSCWTRSGRKLDVIPTIRDSAEFGLAVSKWWYSMQPEFRKTTEETLTPLTCPPEPANASEWTLLAKAGQNGMVSLMMLLVWWKRAMTNRTVYEEDSSTQWALTVKDVTNVLFLLKAMGSQAFKNLPKRKPADTNENEPDSGSKRAKRS